LHTDGEPTGTDSKDKVRLPWELHGMQEVSGSIPLRSTNLKTSWRHGVFYWKGHEARQLLVSRAGSKGGPLPNRVRPGAGVGETAVRCPTGMAGGRGAGNAT